LIKWWGVIALGQVVLDGCIWMDLVVRVIGYFDCFILKWRNGLSGVYWLGGWWVGGGLEVGGSFGENFVFFLAKFC
jgi:hypothetical protein